MSGSLGRDDQSGPISFRATAVKAVGEAGSRRSRKPPVASPYAAPTSKARRNPRRRPIDGNGVCERRSSCLGRERADVRQVGE